RSAGRHRGAGDRSSTTGSARRGKAGEAEHPATLEEKVALLRKEEAEAGEVHLLFVDLDLGKVGVVGHISGQVCRQAVLRVDAEIAGDLGAGSRMRDAIRGDAGYPVR